MEGYTYAFALKKDFYLRSTPGLTVLSAGIFTAGWILPGSPSLASLD